MKVDEPNKHGTSVPFPASNSNVPIDTPIHSLVSSDPFDMQVETPQPQLQPHQSMHRRTGSGGGFNNGIDDKDFEEPCANNLGPIEQSHSMHRRSGSGGGSFFPAVGIGSFFSSFAYLSHILEPSSNQGTIHNQSEAFFSVEPPMNNMPQPQVHHSMHRRTGSTDYYVTDNTSNMNTSTGPVSIIVDQVVQPIQHQSMHRRVGSGGGGFTNGMVLFEIVIFSKIFLYDPPFFFLSYNFFRTCNRTTKSVYAQANRVWWWGDLQFKCSHSSVFGS